MIDMVFVNIARHKRLNSEPFDLISMTYRGPNPLRKVKPTICPTGWWNLVDFYDNFCDTFSTDFATRTVARWGGTQRRVNG
jgi:hypothetical protein